MASATQFSVGLDNKPGALAKLCGSLIRAKVNIEAISVADTADCCWVRLVASPAAAAKTELTGGRYNFTTQRVLTVRAVNAPGQLERIAARLAKAKVNINYVYASGVRGADSLVVLGVSNLSRAARALGG